MIGRVYFKLYRNQFQMMFIELTDWEVFYFSDACADFIRYPISKQEITGISKRDFSAHLASMHFAFLKTQYIMSKINNSIITSDKCFSKSDLSYSNLWKSIPARQSPESELHRFQIHSLFGHYYSILSADYCGIWAFSSSALNDVINNCPMFVLSLPP